ncbi:MAG: hypothetical protein AAFQ87_07085 [Bacteroidota bacterium]
MNILCLISQAQGPPSTGNCAQAYDDCFNAAAATRDQALEVCETYIWPFSWSCGVDAQNAFYASLARCGLELRACLGGNE